MLLLVQHLLRLSNLSLMPKIKVFQFSQDSQTHQSSSSELTKSTCPPSVWISLHKSLSLRNSQPEHDILVCNRTTPWSNSDHLRRWSLLNRQVRFFQATMTMSFWWTKTIMSMSLTYRVVPLSRSNLTKVTKDARSRDISQLKIGLLIRLLWKPWNSQSVAQTISKLCPALE